MQPPRRRDDAMLVRGVERGMYWQAPDGMVVHVAAREERRRYLPPEPRQLEACAPEGGIVHAAARVTPHPRAEPSRVGAAGLAMALWMRLFADSA
ncbi:MAG TPA: hypothetical protein VGR63_13160 [Casimicrobiaceae bacterium]|jgi:hypothetical protein|nr:hypothetical protein [Casimicrobiaceae bacterium]